MPTPLNNLRMHPAGNKMMIRKRNPITLTDLARFSPCTRPHGWTGRHARRVLYDYRAQEVGQVGGVGDYAVDC